MNRSRTGLLISALLILFSALPAFAQSSGRITGTVRDAGGAPVGGAPVTVRNQETGAAQVVRSASNGAYEAANLAPGLYTVTVDVQVFAERNPRELVCVKVTEASLTYVAVGTDRRPRELPA